MYDEIIDRLDAQRSTAGYLTVAEIVDSFPDSIVFDPFSTLISREVRLGARNIIYPNVVIACQGVGACKIGDENTLHPGTSIIADNGGRIFIGSRCELGPGGAQIKANRQGAVLHIDSDVRLLNGAELVGSSRVGSGAQVLGPITAINVHLAGGDTYQGPNPDSRGAVLKGFGRAAGLRLGQGDVVNGVGDFSEIPVERQSSYHPRGK